MEESVLAKKRVASTEEGARAIGERITTLRKARGITQVEFAEKLGISQALVSKYERGELLLHAELLGHVATALRVSSDELLGLQKRKPSTAPVAPLVDRTLARRFTLVQALPRRDRDALARTIDAFLSARGGPGRAA
ncbi:MAG: helix-turn-helix domain-containing protein [Archangiaceae bacterium]|nr:helix-turn-helix domain-containing protein [Archangiaceae bacterium]